MSRKHQLILFLCATALGSLAEGILDSIFNNYLDEIFHITEVERGWLEFPREFPGFMVVAAMGLLCMLSVPHLALIGAVLFAAGMVGIVLAGDNFWLMVAMMMVGSMGMHILQPTGQSLILGLSDEHNKGRHMALAGIIGGLGVMLGAGIVWLLEPSYAVGFSVIAGVFLIVAVVYAFMHIPNLHQRRARLVFKKKFALFYVLELFFGARKQIFITFGIWVLIKVHGLDIADIGFLFAVGAVAGICFRYAAGHAIDRLGERVVLVFDGLALAVVCIGYGYATHLTSDADWARRIACTCFVCDDLLFTLGNGRSVYVSRIADSPEELTSTLSMGVSIDHIASMLVPAAAGYVWQVFGHERVFLWAAVLAVVIAAISSLVPPRSAWKHYGTSKA